jgi:Zn-dependent peptidase ImmA (M78 family)
MLQKKEVGRQALRNALETRRRVSTSKSQPICVYDVAEHLGVKVIFCPESSLGGLYTKTSQTILVPAHRPPGRQAFTCAHELGHYLFGHGSRVDEIKDIDRNDITDPEERLVNTYAGYLLMPPWAVKEAFARRQWNPNKCTPLQAYTVAVQLGVSYTSLVQYLLISLNLISESQAKKLLKTTPKQIRRSILGSDCTRYLVIADQAWAQVAIDLQVGDIAILPSNVRLEGSSIAVLDKHDLGSLIEGRAPGISRAESFDGSWASFIRVPRKDYIGWNAYRHWEDPDFNENADTDK